MNGRNFLIMVLDDEVNTIDSYILLLASQVGMVKGSWRKKHLVEVKSRGNPLKKVKFWCVAQVED